jgi:hypothetical protein
MEKEENQYFLMISKKGENPITPWGEGRRWRGDG